MKQLHGRLYFWLIPIGILAVGFAWWCTHTNRSSLSISVPPRILQQAEEYVSMQQSVLEAEQAEYVDFGLEQVGGTTRISPVHFERWYMDDLDFLGTYSGYDLYSLQYRLLPDRKDALVLIGGHTLTDDGWFTEGQKTVLLFSQNNGSEQLVGGLQTELSPDGNSTQFYADIDTFVETLEDKGTAHPS